MATPLSTPDALAMLAECFGTTADALSPDTARDAVPGWDSMGALMLMAELDERFGIELSAENSRAMRRVSDVLAFLRTHQLLLDAA